MPLTIQSYASRFDSIRQSLSHMAWQEGVGAFFNYQVPFSYSTGKTLAKAISAFIQAHDQHTGSPDTYNFAEYGAGMGMLTKHILDDLQTNYPDLYQRTDVEISDYSQPLINQLEQLSVLKDHEHHHHFTCKNILTPPLENTPSPAIITMSYLLDCLPCRHIEVENGTLYEWKVKTKIKPNTIIIDSAQMPPNIMTDEDIKDLCTSANNTKQKELIYQLSNAIEEEWKRFPIEIEDPQELALLQEYANTLPKTDSHKFNFSIDILTCLTQIKNHLDPNGIVLIQDFGLHHPSDYKNPDQLLTNYSAVIATPLCFDLLQFLAQKADLTYTSTNLTSGNSQLIMLAHQDTAKALETTFNTHFSTLTPNLTYDAAPDIEQFKTDTMFTSWLETKERQLSPTDQEDYYWQVQIGEIAYELHLYDIAEDYFKRSLTSYGAVAVSSYLFLGEIARKQKDYRTAITYYLQGLSIDPQFPFILNSLSLCLAQSGDYVRYLECVDRYFKYSISDRIWEQLITKGLILLQLHRKEDARTLFKWIIQTAADYNNLVPETVEERAIKVSHQFFG